MATDENPRHNLIGLAVASPASSPASAKVDCCGGLSMAPRVGSATLRLPSQRSGDTTRAGMVWIAGGTFAMGTNDPRFPDARPVHDVQVDGFWIDRTDVTNGQFARFVEATGYQTVAERRPDLRHIPNLPKAMLLPGAAVFTPPKGPVPLGNPTGWWRYVPGACWRHPQGPGSDLLGREDHPVVTIAWPDAVAYATWSGKRLPTEAEWEYAARGGLDRKPYVWGDELHPNGKYMANIFQGDFPHHDTAADGFAGTSPVGSFPPNGYGLYDMSGNVWQWCADWYDPAVYRRSANTKLTVNPKGPDRPGVDPQEPGMPKRVMRGGSFLCNDLYCSRYMVGGRGKGDPNTALNHVGFRCVADAAHPENPSQGYGLQANGAGSAR